MRLLVLGGTWFVGRALVECAVARGDQVTIFNRGQTSPSPRAVHHVRGDRTSRGDLALLAEFGPWDAVVDVHGVVPAQVRDAAVVLRPTCDRYVFVSSVSAYRDWPAEPVAESSPTHTADPDADPGDWRWGTGVYGPLKAGAEAALRLHYPVDRLLVLRPGVIVGPHEYGGRLTWWLRRAACGGRMLAPGRPQDPIRPVDARDLARFILVLLDTCTHGVFNVAGPPGRDTFGELIAGCLDVTNSRALVTWINADWLRERGVREWTELPLWRTQPGTWAIDSRRATAAGLVCRPLRITAEDTWSWLRAGGEPVHSDRQARHGIDPGREAALLEEWDLSLR